MTGHVSTILGNPIIRFDGVKVKGTLSPKRLNPRGDIGGRVGDPGDRA